LSKLLMNPPLCRRNEDLLANLLAGRIDGMHVDKHPARSQMLRFLYHPAFWDRKVRIAILTLATFAALC